MELASGRGAWLHVVSGNALVNNRLLTDGDSVAIEDEDISLIGQTPSEVLLFDLK